MKSKSIILTAILTALPSVLMAQENIQKAFDALLSKNNTEIATRHSLERDPETGRKTSQANVYDLMVTSPSAFSLIKDIQKAFEKDREAAYLLRSGDHAGDNYTTLAVGDDNTQPIAIGKMKGSNYVYACFLDKDDPEKKHRYAYALEWVERNESGKSTQVRLAVTYATTQKHRQGKQQKRRFIINGKEINIDGNSFSLGSGFPFDDSSVFDSDSLFFNSARSSESWLSEFNTYKNLFLKKPDGTASSHYATSIYKLCKNADSLDEAERGVVAQEIAKLNKSTNDDFIKELFLMCIKRLGK